MIPFPVNYPRRLQFSHSFPFSLEVCSDSRTCSWMLGKTAGSLTLFGQVNIVSSSGGFGKMAQAIGHSLPSVTRFPALGRLHVKQWAKGCLQWLRQQTKLSNLSDVTASVLTSGAENSGSCECVGLSRTSIFCVLVTIMGNKRRPLLRVYLFYRMGAQRVDLGHGF